MRSKNGEGFTLIELLVVVAIIGLLSSIISAAVSASRLKSRDARRLTDAQQMKTGLDLYYNLGGGYPSESAWTTSQNTGNPLVCVNQDTLRVPQDQLAVGDPSFAYVYTQGGSNFAACGGTVYSNFKVQFKTEGNTSLGPAGTYYLSPLGISSTAPF